MDKALEEKLNQINTNVLGIKQDLEVVKNTLTGVEGRLAGAEDKLTGVEGRLAGAEEKLTGFENKLDGFIEFSNERSTRIEDAIENTKKEILEALSKNKLETVDKYATNERVDKHEVRIQKLEANIA